MAKMKFDVQGFLLRKGEVLVMAVTGFFLAVLLIWGATKWTSAKDPTKTADELKKQSKQVYARIDGSVGQPDPADVAVDLDGIKCLSLPTLVQLKLASGTAAWRMKDYDAAAKYFAFVAQADCYFADRIYACCHRLYRKLDQLVRYVYHAVNRPVNGIYGPSTDRSIGQFFPCRSPHRNGCCRPRFVAAGHLYQF